MCPDPRRLRLVDPRPAGNVESWELDSLRVKAQSSFREQLLVSLVVSGTSGESGSVCIALLGRDLRESLVRQCFGPAWRADDDGGVAEEVALNADIAPTGDGNRARGACARRQAFLGGHVRDRFSHHVREWLGCRHRVLNRLVKEVRVPTSIPSFREWRVGSCSIQNGGVVVTDEVAVLVEGAVAPQRSRVGDFQG